VVFTALWAELSLVFLYVGLRLPIVFYHTESINCNLIQIPVQPMKAIASFALAGNLTQLQVMAAGFVVAAIVFVLSALRTIQLFYRAIPLPIVRGIQLGTGVTLWVLHSPAKFGFRSGL
jgi:hypothetical protein